MCHLRTAGDHEALETGIAYPGVYDSASETDGTRPYHPICDPCVRLIEQVEAARRHFYAGDPSRMPRLRREFGSDPPTAYPPLSSDG